MSHQVRQISAVQIDSLDLLGLAVSSVHVPSLGTNLRLNTEAKQARFWNGHMDTCDAVITYARPLTDTEKSVHYEIAVKRELADGPNNTKVPVFALYADTHASDRDMENKLNAVFEEYEISKLRRVGQEQGALEVEEVTNAGEFEIPDGYRCIKITTP
jgi:hypothetical protein